MKINENYIIQHIADEHLVIPLAEEADKLKGVLRLNKTGAFLWEMLFNGIDSEDQLITALMEEYSVDFSTAKADIDSFLKALDSIGCLE